MKIWKEEKDRSLVYICSSSIKLDYRITIYQLSTEIIHFKHLSIAIYSFSKLNFADKLFSVSDSNSVIVKQDPFAALRYKEFLLLIKCRLLYLVSIFIA